MDSKTKAELIAFLKISTLKTELLKMENILSEDKKVIYYYLRNLTIIFLFIVTAQYIFADHNINIYFAEKNRKEWSFIKLWIVPSLEKLGEFNPYNYAANSQEGLYYEATIKSNREEMEKFKEWDYDYEHKINYQRTNKGMILFLAAFFISLLATIYCFILDRRKKQYISNYAQMRQELLNFEQNEK